MPTRNHLIALLATAALILAASPTTATAEETITAYDVRVEIDAEDASLLVTETIAVTADGDRIRRGIFRDFPTLNKGPLGLRKPVTFDVVSVLHNNQPEPYSVEGLQDGRRVRIGDPDVFLDPGPHTYTLVYRTGGQLRTFPAYEELYWNATGHFWDFPIVRATVTAVVPAGAEIIDNEEVSPTAYVGAPGETGTPDDFTIDIDRNATVTFRVARTMQPGEGVTVAVPFTKGTVNHRTTGLGALLAANWAYLLGALLVLGATAYHVAAWCVAGKDPQPGTLIPQFEPPEGFSPAACRFVKKMRFDQKTFAAAVIGLAVKNALRITGDKDDSFTLRHPEKSGDRTPLLKDEAALFNKLLHNRESLKLEKSNHSKIRAARERLKNALTARFEKTHFVHNLHLWVPGLLATLLGVALTLFNASNAPAAFFLAVWLTAWSAGCAVLVSVCISQARQRNLFQAAFMALFAIPFLGAWGVAFASFAGLAGTGAIALFIAGVAVNATFYHLIKAPTHAGRQVLDEIDGFEEYLKTAEEERLNLETPPEKTPELFERFLPYALALDCEQQWADKFTAVLAAASTAPADGAARHTYHPHWYGGRLGASDLATGTFASAIGSAMTASLASAAQSPSSSSGSSGGGFSGGGGGGGGDGGW